MDSTNQPINEELFLNFTQVLTSIESRLSSLVAKKDIELMDIDEAATFLNIKISKIRSLVFKKEIPVLRFGRNLRFKRGDLLNWIENCSQ